MRREESLLDLARWIVSVLSNLLRRGWAQLQLCGGYMNGEVFPKQSSFPSFVIYCECMS